MQSAVLLFIVVLALSHGSGHGIAISEIGERLKFSMWMRTHQKSYTSAEFLSRYEIFKDNSNFVDEWNSNPEHTHQVELNFLADLSNAEYQKIYLGTHYEAPSTPLFVPAPPQDAPLNWNDKGVVTPVKDQGNCGSCWSFSATGSVEGAYALKTGNLVSLSEQNLMDCSLNYGNMGCQGGLMDLAFDYIIANGGIDTEVSYPYTTKNGLSCKFSAANIGANISSYTDISSGSEAALITALQSQPVSVAIDASKQSFQLYKSGVYYEAACSSTRLDHGVLAVGYGTDTNSTQDYYIVKNSWGSAWGQAGYLWMSRNRSNNCGIATMSSYPIV